MSPLTKCWVASPPSFLLIVSELALMVSVCVCSLFVCFVSLCVFVCLRVFCLCVCARLSRSVFFLSFSLCGVSSPPPLPHLSVSRSSFVHRGLFPSHIFSSFLFLSPLPFFSRRIFSPSPIMIWLFLLFSLFFASIILSALSTLLHVGKGKEGEGEKMGEGAREEGRMRRRGRKKAISEERKE